MEKLGEFLAEALQETQEALDSDDKICSRFKCKLTNGGTDMSLLIKSIGEKRKNTKKRIQQKER